MELPDNGAVTDGLRPTDPAVSIDGAGILGTFNRAGILHAADVHVARRLGTLFGERDERVLLAVALAVRAPRLSSVCVDLAELPPAHELAAAIDADRAPDPTPPGVEDRATAATLAWPEREVWRAAVAASALTAVGADGRMGRPLRLLDTTVYLDRFWRDERLVAEQITARSTPVDGVDVGLLANGVTRLFAPPEPLPGQLVAVGGEDSDPERLTRFAAATGVLRRFAVVTGGPGTGKTWTVAGLVTLVCEQEHAAGRRLPHVALAAPTGKAAARLEESVRSWVAANVARLDPVIAAHVADLKASTLHRLLRTQPGSRTRFRFRSENRLPHDLVVVDETSMMALSMMARLLEAVRDDARVVIVGDHEQLASVEAGAVLADVVGPATVKLRMSTHARSALEQVCGATPPADPLPKGTVVGDGIIVLRHSYRFGSGIGDLASAIRSGDGNRVVATLDLQPPGVRWFALDPAGDRDGTHAPDALREAAVSSGEEAVTSARVGDDVAAVRALRRFRLLCGHREGPYGVAAWQARIEDWLADAVPGFGTEGPWYPGRPLLVTANDYDLGLYNGDTGVVVRRDDGRVEAVFDRSGAPVPYSPSRLADVETAFAMTVHKAQGSQFAQVAVVLPEPSSRVLTRELLYTAVTRAEKEVLVIGTEDAVRAAVSRPVGRASGLRRWLWGDGASGVGGAV